MSKNNNNENKNKKHKINNEIQSQKSLDKGAPVFDLKVYENGFEISGNNEDFIPCPVCITRTLLSISSALLEDSEDEEDDETPEIDLTS